MQQVLQCATGVVAFSALDIDAQIEERGRIDHLARRERIELAAPLKALVDKFRSDQEIAATDFEHFEFRCAELREAHAARTSELPAFKWLDSQRGLEEAFKSMRRAERRREKPVNPSDRTFSAELSRVLQTLSRSEALRYIGPQRTGSG